MDSIIDQREDIYHNIRCLLDGELKEYAPVAYRNIESNINYLMEIYNIALNNINNGTSVYDEEDGRVIFPLSIPYICDFCNIKNKSKFGVGSKLLPLLFHEFVYIHEGFKASNDIEIQSKVTYMIDRKEYQNHILVSIPSLVTDFMEDMNERGKEWCIKYEKNYCEYIKQ